MRGDVACVVPRRDSDEAAMHALADVFRKGEEILLLRGLEHTDRAPAHVNLRMVATVLLYVGVGQDVSGELVRAMHFASLRRPTWTRALVHFGSSLP